MSTRLCVVCDRCGTRSPEEKNAGQRVSLIRAALLKRGWQVSGTRCLDYCPKCKEFVNARSSPKPAAE